MKITDLDKRRVIKRTPEFKKDCARYNELRNEPKEDDIALFKIDFLTKWGYEFEAILNADEVAKYRQDKPTVEAIVRFTDKPFWITYEKEKTPINLTGDSLYLKLLWKAKPKLSLWRISSGKSDHIRIYSKRTHRRNETGKPTSLKAYGPSMTYT